jgi:hypothetical protein
MSRVAGGAPLSGTSSSSPPFNGRSQAGPLVARTTPSP